jgi:hypothetical protein
LISLRPALVLLACVISVSNLAAQAPSLGLFQSQADIGSVAPAGGAVYDPAAKTYTLTAAGENMWAKTDAFHFLWKKASGDLAISADIRFPHPGGNPHRKAALLFRQSLDADAVYADAAVHGSGLTSLQFRETRGDYTRDAELNIDLPTRVRVEKRGDRFTLFLAQAGQPLRPSGMDITLHLEGEYYLGLGLCSHDKSTTETAVFSNVSIEPLGPPTTDNFTIHSTLQTISTEPQFRRSIVAYTADSYFEAPNWSRDGKDLIFDMDGRILRVPADSPTLQAPQTIDTGDTIHCNGSHGLSPDGTLLAITCETTASPGARIYLVPSAGGKPRMLTETPQSYFHSWSPDGKTIAFIRPGNGLNIVTIPITGGSETALTATTSINDDSDYSPDGKYVYFNSDRGKSEGSAEGAIQLWRMNAEGSNPVQITHDERNNWTPHPSPDGKWIVYISYPHSVTTHAVNKEIELRLLSLEDGTITTLNRLLGGSGTMNVPSWSPDSKHLAYVGYELIPAEK